MCVKYRTDLWKDDHAQMCIRKRTFQDVSMCKTPHRLVDKGVWTTAVRNKHTVKSSYPFRDAFLKTNIRVCAFKSEHSSLVFWVLSVLSVPECMCSQDLFDLDNVKHPYMVNTENQLVCSLVLFCPSS